jgi:hypothetical protein
VPPLPPGFFLKKYAGTYSLLVNGVTTSDKYVLKADGTSTWTFQADKPTIIGGTWIANEGMIQLLFSLLDFEKGDELISDYRLQNGTFKADGGLSLKKIVKAAPVKKIITSAYISRIKLNKIN